MPDYSAGEAKLSIVPDLKGFTRKLENDLRAIDAELAVRVGADTAQARADIDRFRELQRRDGIQIGVETSLAGASAEMATWRAAQEARSIRQKVDVDTGGALAALGALAKFNAPVLAVGSLPAVATALATVASSLQQVSQAGLALPGIVGGAVASIGTLKLATAGTGDALKAMWAAADSGDPKDLKKASDALKDMSPNAAAALTAVTSFHDQFKSLRNTVQDNVFAGVDTEFKAFANKTLPTLTAGLGKTSTAWNATIREMLRVGKLDSTQGFLAQILGNTADAQTRANAAIAPITHAIGTLTATSSNVLPRLGDGLGKAAERFDAFISKAAADGRLDAWINQGVTGVTKLADTLINVAKSFTAITQAAGGGDGLLTVLERGSQKMSDFLNSTAGQDKLKKFFEDGREQLRQWMPIVENLGRILPGVFQAAHDVTSAWLPMLNTITGWLADSPEGVRLVAESFVAWKTVSGITSLITSLGTVKTTLLGLPTAADTAAGGISAALGRVVVPAWLAYLAGQQNDARHPDIASALKAANNGDQSKIQGLFDDIDREHRGLPTHGGFNLQAPTPAQSREHRDLPPYDPTGGLLTLPGPGQPAPPPAPAGPTNPLEALVPHYAGGGPTPSGRGNGPTGGFISELHGDEWVLPAHARAAIGDKALWALTNGRSFATGGYVDPFGNPVTAGMLPGPSTPMDPASPVATNPAGGGIGNIFGAFLSGLPGPLGNLNALLPGGGTQQADTADSGTKLLGGFAGLAQAGNDPNLLDQWGIQTGDWLGKFGANFATKFATTLYGGALDFFGLGSSILSPSNQWFQAGAKAAGFYLGNDGPLATLTGSPGSPKSGGKAVTAQQVREAKDKSTDRDNALAVAQARLAELPADAKQSVRLAAQNAVDKARREAQEARDDLAQYQQGVNPSSAKNASLAGGLSLVPGQFGALDALAAKMGLTMTSGFRDPNGPTIAGVAANASYHGQGRAHDYSGNEQAMIAFADFMADNYGSQLKELIFSAPGFTKTIKDGRVVGPFGAFYTLAQAGNHSDHVHIAYDQGGWLMPGTALTINQTGKPEAVLNPAQTQAYQTVAAHIEKQGAAIQPSVPQLPDVRKLAPRGSAVIPSAPTTPLPAPATPAPVAPPPTDPTDQQPQQTPYAGPTPVAPVSGDLNHNLAAINTGISSGAAAIGNAAAAAISGAAGGFGGGSVGSLVSGLFGQGGKILTDAVNVGSSFLVGNVTTGTTPNAYGELNIGAQNVPSTAPDNRTYNTHIQAGYRPADLIEALELKEARDMQARLAAYS